MNKIFMILCTMLFVGCAAQPVLVNISNIESSDSLTTLDLRPPTEKESEIFSLLISSEAYGTYRRGDNLLTTPALRVLQHRAHESFSFSSESPEIKVHHFVVYMNLKSELRRGVAGGVLLGPLGAVMASGTKNNVVNGINSIVDREYFNALADNEYKRALYKEEENPNKASVFLVYIDAEIDGERAFVRTMTPFELPDGLNPHVVAVETAIEYFLEQLRQPGKLSFDNT